MSAISLPSGNLLDLLFDQTGRIEREAKKGGALLSRFGATGGFYQRQIAKAKFLLLVRDAISLMRKNLELTHQSTAWFRNFHDQVAQAELAFSDFQIEQVLKRFESSQASSAELQKLVAASLPRIIGSAISSREKMARSELAHRFNRSLVENYAAMEEVRWLFLERKADNDIAAGKISKAYSTVEDLFASLRS